VTQVTQRRQAAGGTATRSRPIRGSALRRSGRRGDALRAVLGVLGVLLYLGSSVVLSIHGHPEATGAAAPHALASHAAAAHHAYAASYGAAYTDAYTDAYTAPETNTDARRDAGAARDDIIVDVPPAFDARDPGEDRSPRSALHDCRLCELAQRAGRASLAPPTAASSIPVPVQGRPRIVSFEPAPAGDPALRRQAPRAPPHRLRT